MKTLEQYFKENIDKGVIDHSLRASIGADGKVGFYIHLHADGDTLDFKVAKNELMPKR